MDDLDLIIDLHIEGTRQGPGSDETTRIAIQLAGLDKKAELKIADIGCGTGAPTFVLASELDAHITAVDFLQPFLDQLANRAEQQGLDKQIATSQQSMDELKFEESSLDVIWSEGAIYNIGFQTGIENWRRFLKPGGILAVSEITWLTHERPPELEDYWTKAYPQITTASANLQTLESCGYAPLGYFPLASQCWLQNYYRPMQQRFESFLDKHGKSQKAQSIVTAEQREIEFYERFKEFYSYGFYIAKRSRKLTS